VRERGEHKHPGHEREGVVVNRSRGLNRLGVSKEGNAPL
jgi:hypothetical protein